MTVVSQGGQRLESGADWIKVNKVADLTEEGFVANEQCLVPALEEVTALAVVSIESIGEGCLGPGKGPGKGVISGLWTKRQLKPPTGGFLSRVQI